MFIILSYQSEENGYPVSKWSIYINRYIIYLKLLTTMMRIWNIISMVQMFVLLTIYARFQLYLDITKLKSRLKRARKKTIVSNTFLTGALFYGWLSLWKGKNEKHFRTRTLAKQRYLLQYPLSLQLDIMVVHKDPKRIVVGSNCVLVASVILNTFYSESSIIYGLLSWTARLWQ